MARDRSVRSAGVERLRDFLLGKQEKVGSWKPGGHLPSQKRPVGETAQVSTMLCVLGLATLEMPNDKTKECIAAAVAWLMSTPPNGKDPAVSGEWYRMRLLVAKKYGEPTDVAALSEQILAAQQADGGWGWLWADKSDAFGTGLALYALAEGGAAGSHPAAVERAWRFLIETQTEAGSWIVNGTKADPKDRPHAMSGFWGSTWALHGLSKTLPAATKKETASETLALSLPASSFPTKRAPATNESASIADRRSPAAGT